MKSINKKMTVVFFSILLFLILPGMLFAQQNDFYGTWVTKISELNETILIEFTISASNFIMSYELYEDNKLIDTEVIEARINNWSSMTNSDSTSRVNYPNGFLITMDFYGMEIPIEIYISRDRRQFTIPELNEDWDEIVVFMKQ